MAKVAVVCTIARTAVAENKKPYAVVKPDNGGSFCIFPKVGEAKAYDLVSQLKAGATVTLTNVGFYNGSVIVYNNTTVK